MAEAMKANFEAELEKMKQIEKDREKYICNRQQLESQLTENKLVKEELSLLEDDAKVYKLIGAVLVNQELAEARANVDKRIEYITAELKRVEDGLTDVASKQSAQRDKLVGLQEKLKSALSAGGGATN